MILIAMLLICIILYILSYTRHNTEHTGGDPYSNIRFWIIVDVLRNFWLTK